MEIALVTLFALVVSQSYLNFDPHLGLPGEESEYLTNSATWLETSFRQYGYLPYWQPYLDRGQPTVDEAYSFLANPFAFYPILTLGAVNGLKVSIALHFVLVGVGGWFLGRVLGWSWLARLLLACLLIMKGNMQSMIADGYYQLGVSQAFFPWAFAGAMGIVRFSRKRWPVVLAGMAIAFTYLAGNVYFTLVTCIIVVLPALFYGITVSQNPWRIRIQRRLIMRFLLAACIAVGIAAISALSVTLTFGLVHGHFFEPYEPTTSLANGILQLVSPELLTWDTFGGQYSYVAPIWLAILVFVVLPPIGWLQRRASRSQNWRFWAMLLAGFLLFFTWGLGINPLLAALYQNETLLSHWRFVSRMLAVAAFYFVVLLAFRVDGLYRSLLSGMSASSTNNRRIRIAGALGLILLCGLAVTTVGASRQTISGLWDRELEQSAKACVTWLRDQHPGEFLSARRPVYRLISPFIALGVRHETIGAAYDLSGVDSTLYPFDLTTLAPEYYLVDWFNTPEELRSYGYQPVDGSPLVSESVPLPCVWRNPDTVAYAFSVPLDTLTTVGEPLPARLTRPVEILSWRPGSVTLRANSDPNQPSVVALQEIAYPGWEVRLNGAAANLDSIGQLVGVTLPPGQDPVLVEFEFTAPLLKLGGIMSLVTILFCIGYLVRADRLLKRRSRPGPDALAAGHSAPEIGAAPASTEAAQPLPPDGQLSAPLAPSNADSKASLSSGESPEAQDAARSPARIPLIIAVSSAIAATLTALVMLLIRRARRSD